MFDKIICLFIRKLYVFENLIIDFFIKILFKNNNIFEAKNIIIFRTGSFGDSLCSLPAISTIRNNFPFSNIDVLTNSGGNNLISINSLIKEGIVNNIIDYIDIDKKSLFKKLKKNKYDLFIDLSQDPASLKTIIRNMIIVKILNIKCAFGWSINSIKIFTKYQNNCMQFEQETFRLLNTLKKYKFVLENINYNLNIKRNDEEKINKILEENNLLLKDKNIIFIVGAKRTTNRWPIAYFSQVCKYLLEKEYNVLFIGGKEDTHIVKQVGDDPNIYDFTGMLTPMESAVLLKNARLVISNDTGPMHLAYIVKTPVIAIFSSRDYKNKWYPIDNENVINIIHRNDAINCVNCFVEECTNNNICMTEITPDLVINDLKYYKI